MNASSPLLHLDGLSLRFTGRGRPVHVLDGVDLIVRRGETVGLVGESGSGKSVTAMAILGILGGGAYTSGRIVFAGCYLVRWSADELAGIRGRELSMVFQNPRVALNPIRSVGRQIEDVLLRHADLPRGKVRERAIELLAAVRIPDPERRHRAYPCELSGGMCQRVMIALAIACSPALLIADEPTTGLDVTTQRAIMELLRDLAGRRGMATILITHDLALAAESCQRIAVMHAGHVVEVAPVADLFARPRHPYTTRLIATTPRPGAALADLAPIPGGLPDLRLASPPCRYRDRCERRLPECDAPLPRIEVAPDHIVACRSPA